MQLFHWLKVIKADGTSSKIVEALSPPTILIISFIGQMPVKQRNFLGVSIDTLVEKSSHSQHARMWAGVTSEQRLRQRVCCGTTIKQKSRFRDREIRILVRPWESRSTTLVRNSHILPSMSVYIRILRYAHAKGRLSSPHLQIISNDYRMLLRVIKRENRYSRLPEFRCFLNYWYNNERCTATVYS